MARIRSIKPEQTKDEALAVLSIHARYLFAFLPTQADREGRLEDRPRVIKLEIFPWDEVDVDAILNELCPHFIVRYEVEGRRYIQIRTFLKHQRPNNKELPSIIPNPTKDQLNDCFIQKKRSLIQNEGIRECVGKGKVEGTDVAPLAQETKLSVLDSKESEPEILPSLTPLQFVIRAFKVSKNVDPNDVAWDRKHFARNTRAAKDLISVFDGDYERAAEYLIEKGLEWAHLPDWGIEAISKAAGRESATITQGEKYDEQREQMVKTGVLEHGRHPRITSTRSLALETIRGIEHSDVSEEEFEPI